MILENGSPMPPFTLATTPYVLLTSILVIRFVLAAGLAGELGNPKNFLKSGIFL